MDQPRTGKIRWLRPRFGMRSLLILMAVVAVVYGSWIRQSLIQREAANYLQRQKQQVVMGKPQGLFGWLPESVLEIGGGHLFCPVESVTIDRNAEENSCDETMRAVGRLKSLKTVSIEGTELIGEHFQSLSQCNKLEQIDLEYCSFQLSDFTELSELPKLQVLSLKGSQIVGDGSLELKRFPHLSGLDLKGVFLPTQRIEDLNSLRELQWINLSRTIASDEMVERLTCQSTLVWLSLDDTWITSEGCKSLKSFTALTDLDLSNTKVDDKGVAQIVDLPNLRNLQVNNCNVGDVSALAITRMSQLADLCLGGTGMTSIGLAKLSRMERLVSIELPYVPIEIETILELRKSASIELIRFDGTADNLAEGFHQSSYDASGTIALFKNMLGLNNRHLSDLESTVTELDLSKSSFDPNIFSVLQGWGNLISIDLSETRVGEQELAAIGALHQLQSLDLNSTSTTDVGVGHLADLRELKYLDLRNTEVSDQGLLNSKLPSLLSHINLEGTLVTDQGVAGLRHLKELERINLPFDPKCSTILDLFNSCPKLRQVTSGAFSIAKGRGLDFGNLEMSSDDLHRLLTLIAQGQLKSSRFQDEHCKVLAAHPGIEELDLSGSPISDRGVAHISALSNLKVLEMANTNVTTEGLKLVAKGCSLDSLKVTFHGKSADFVEAALSIPSEILICDFDQVSADIARMICSKTSAKAICIDERGDSRFGNSNGLLIKRDMEWYLNAENDPGYDGYRRMLLVGPLIDERHLNEVKASPFLQTCTIINVGCSLEVALEKLSQFKLLQKLEIYDMPISKDSLRALQNMPQLRELVLVRCQVGDTDLEAISKCLYLSNLDLRSNRITGTGIESMVRSLRLNALLLTSNPISTEQFPILERLKKEKVVRYLNW